MSTAAAASEKTPLMLNSGDIQQSSSSKPMLGSGCETVDSEQSMLTPEELAKTARAKTSLIIAIIFCILFMIVELTMGLIAHSLAILTDAAHMLTDVGSLALALFAVVASQWKASEQFTFGFKRAEVVGALFSVMLVWGLVGAIIYEGINRSITVIKCAAKTESKYTECERTEPKIMLIVGCLGLVVNIGYALILTWGGADVRHAHSHGGDGDDEDDHGHSHGGHGHAHGGHGHSHGASSPSPKVKCCTPSAHELACDNEAHGHEHLKSGGSRINTGDLDAAVAATGGGGGGGGDDHGHGHSHNGGAHGHSHGGSGSHGHSHGGGGGGGGCDDKKKKTDSGKQQEEEEEEEDNNMNLNLRGAAVHALGDCLQSVGVIIAAAVIWIGAGGAGSDRSYYNIADPACSLLFAFITLWTTKSLFIEVFGILMERAPRGIHQQCIRRKLEHLPTVRSVQELHIWSISIDRLAMGAHLVLHSAATADEIFDTLAVARQLAYDLGFVLATFEVVRAGSSGSTGMQQQQQQLAHRPPLAVAPRATPADTETLDDTVDGEPLGLSPPAPASPVSPSEV